ncbi:MAG TPA: alpha/beta fold hydrolase [Oleiagrimonas sp.]|nr:alpha/beta fold hydrolase [Oleiagrimonas sp.]
MFAVGWAVFAFAAATAAAPSPVAPSMDALLRRPQYERVEISPDGSLLAIAYRVDGGTRISVVRRTDMKPVAQVAPGRRGEVHAMAWLGSHQLVVSANRRSKRYWAPIVASELYLLDIHKKHPKILPANFIGTIEGDDQHILVRGCGGFDEDGDCIWGIRRLDTQHLNREGTPVATAPIADSRFLIDHAGHVRFAWAWDDKARSRLYVHQADGKWKLLNDSNISHVDVVPVGISRDNTTAFLQAERRKGPDAIESYDFASGKKTVLLHDKVSDPLAIIWSLDLKEPIGAWFGPGRPHARYFNPESPDAKWHRALAKAFPDSNATVASASADGTELVVFTWSDRDDGSYYLLDRSTHKMQLLFHVRPWLDPEQLATVTPFTFRARDGLPLHGFLAMPTDGAHPAPMVVVIHGGPYYIRDTWAFDEETQLLATRGYAVLHVNFRGSGGFGLSFIERGYRQWGRTMQDDITDATRWAIRQGYADPDRICIYGASYGGYAALMGAVREPQLYQCAIGLSGVYDLNQLYHWGDIHRSDYGLYYLHHVLGTDEQELAAHSPANLAARITVPVLLAHGELDVRVPVKFAEEMREALDDAEHPPEYVEYDWEGHGLANPEHQHDFYSRLLRFLDNHLKESDSASQ